jgi:uncharacterized protein DUF1629
MTTFWEFMPWLPYWLNAGHLLGRCEFLNGMELVRARPVDGEFVRNELPTLQIKFAAEDFDPDCFDWNGFTLVSERMRHAMAIGPAAIQYFDVDSSRAAPLPRSKRYQIAHVPVTEDVSDLERSEYSLRHRPEGVELFGHPSAVAFRPGAEPAHEIFYDRFFKVVFCTDEFAMRVLRPGSTGMRFLDPADLRGWKRFRTLRGIEENEWDPKRKSFRDRLIREIP